MSADPTHSSEEIPHAHDQAAEVAHAWEHFWENLRFFIGFLTIILLTVLSFNLNFGHVMNMAVLCVLTVARCSLIAYFMASLFKAYSFLFRTFVFTAFFLAGMVFLSWWDSTLPHLGDPIPDVDARVSLHVP